MLDYYAGRPNTERYDCVVKAFTVLTEKPYAEIHALFKAGGRKDGRATNGVITFNVANQLGLKRVNTNVTVATFLKNVRGIPRVAGFVSGHAFGVIGGNFYDLIDNADDEQRLQFYFTVEK